MLDRRASRLAPYRHYPRILASASPAVAHRLCAPIHPVPSLFVFLCVKNIARPFHTRIARGGSPPRTERCLAARPLAPAAGAPGPAFFGRYPFRFLFARIVQYA